MAYVNCSSCKIVVHYNPIDFKEFHRRFVDGLEPIYCFDCFKERMKKATGHEETEDR